MRMNFPFRARRFGRSRAMLPAGGAGHGAVRAFDSYLLPRGAGGHDRDAGRLRALAALHGYDGWLLGCRDRGLRHGRRRVGVTPPLLLGTPSGTIGAALASAGVLHGCEYVLTDAPAAGLGRP